MNNPNAEVDKTTEQINLQALLPTHDDIVNMNDQQVAQWVDARNYNLLMVAAEAGRLETVNHLIQQGVNVNHEVNSKIAATLAFTNKHFQVVLALLKANSKFPRNYSKDKASDELKAFVAISTNLHNKIRANNQENLQEILNENPNLRHYYDIYNNSALKTAIITAMFSMVEFLLNNNIILGPHENIKQIFKRLNEEQVTKLSELHLKLSKHIFSTTLMTLMRNCRFGPDDDGSNNPEYMSLVNKAFNFLLEIPSVAIILKIVAATREFTLVFDFNREWTNFVDPFSEPYTNGIFYLSGKIYIGAKNLLDPLKAIETYSVIAHELCHFAMFLVFKNNAKPYRENELIGEQAFQRISDECKAQMEGEKIIKDVYEVYELDMQHAELIVRAPQMIVLYHNKPEIEEKRALFPTLIDHFEHESVPALENALPAIEKKYRPKVEKQVKKQRKLIILLGFLMVSLISGSIFGAFHLFNPTISYDQLSADDKMSFNNATINFSRVDMKFCELFANDSEVYDLLPSEQLKQALKGNTYDLSRAIDAVYLPFVYLSWANMTKDLRNKTFHSMVNFQGENVLLSKVLSNDSALEFLKPNLIKDILTNQIFNISKPIELKTKFFIDRFFINEDLKVETEQLGVIKYEQRKSFDDVIRMISQERVFLLSNLAGEGKSTTFRYFTLKVKQQFPLKWVQYVDLKMYSKVFKKAKNLNKFDEIMKFLVADLLKLEKFEVKVFENRFKSNEVIFFWDGIDEIAPLYKNFMLQLTSKVHELTKNYQFVSTRPQYSNDFMNNFNLKSHKLIPLGKSERLELLIKFLATKNFNLDVKVFNSQNLSNNYEEEIKNLNLNSQNETLKFLNLIEKGRKIFETIETSENKDRLVTNPLLIEMIAEIILDENFNPDLDLNVYQIFDIFITKKLEILFQKGDEAIKSVIEITKKSFVNIMEVHQAIALQTIFGNHIDIYLSKSGYKTSDFEVMHAINKLSSDELARYGIIQVTFDGEYIFAHQTFAEYLVAQFFIDNFNELRGFKKETKVVLSLFNTVLFTDKFNVVKNFLNNYERSEVKVNSVFDVHKNLSLKLNNLTQNEEVWKLFFYMEFSRFFQTKYGIDYSKYFPGVPYSWNYDEFNELISKWDKFQQVLGKKTLHFAMLLKDQSNESLLDKISSASVDELFEHFLDKMNKILDTSEIESLLTQKTSMNFTTLMIVAWKLNGHNVELFWNLTEKTLTNIDQKQLLMAENIVPLNAFPYATWNQDPDSFLFMKDIYEKFFTRTEIQEFILKTQDQILSFVYSVISEASLETAKEVAKYLAELFKDEKFKLRDILIQRDNLGETVFRIFKNDYEKDYEKKLKVFGELLRETFTELEKSQLEDFEFNLKKDFKLYFYSIDYFEKDLDEFRAFDWFNGNFKIFLSKYNEIQKTIGSENMKILLMSKNKKNHGNLLHELMKNAYGIQVPSVLSLLNSTLSETEMVSLILSQDSFKNSPFIYAAKYQVSTVIENYWKLLNQTLSLEHQTRLLLMENGHFLTALQASTVGDSFQFINKIYKDFFTPKHIQEIILKIEDQNLPFVTDVMRFSSPELCQNVSDYLKHLFKDNKLKLQNLLSHRNARGHTIFTFPILDGKKYENQVKVFEKLANEVNLNLMNLKIPPRFLKNYHSGDLSLREEAWFSNEFNYFTDNFENLRVTFGDENVKKLLLSQNHENKSLLHELILNADDELLEPFLVKVELTLNHSERFTLFSLLDENLQSSLMLAAKFKSQKFLQNYFNTLNRTLSEKELKNLLKVEDKSLWTPLQFSAMNKNENSFNFVTEIYGKFLEEFEIREIILKVQPGKLPFIFDVIEESSIKNCRNIAKFLKNLFLTDKGKLRELLSHFDDEEYSIFNKAEIKKNLQIFNKLFRETFEKNEEEKYTETINSLVNPILPESFLKSIFNASFIMTEIKLREEKDLRKLWNFIETHYNNEQRNILISEDEKYLTALQYAALNRDPNSFLFISKVYGNIFTPSEIQEIVLKFNDDELPFVYSLLTDGQLQTLKEVANYLAKMFENDKILLRKFLSHRNEYGDTIFSKIEGEIVYESHKQVLIKLLRGTFDKNDTESFELFLNSTQIRSEVAYWLLIQQVSNSSDYFSGLISLTWISPDFYFVISKWEKIKLNLGDTYFRLFLMSKNYKNRTILHDLIQYKGNELHIEPFLDKLKENLNNSDISALLFAQDSEYFETALMYAAQYKKENDLTYFWNFIKEFLKEENEQKKLLLVEDREFVTALQGATLNNDSKSFLFMKEIYERFFSPTKIKEIFSKTHDAFLPFVNYAIKLASLDTTKEVKKYLSEIFHGDKLKLREILSHRNFDGETIFSEFKDQEDYEEKLNIFAELLSGTFNKSENFNQFLNSSQIVSRFAFFMSVRHRHDISNDLRSFEWQASDFDYVLYNWEIIKRQLGNATFYSLLTSKNRTLLHDLFQSYEREELVETFLQILKLSLKKSDFSALFYEQENVFNATILMYAARSVDEKCFILFWNFMKDFLDHNGLKKLMMVENRAYTTALQDATTNNDPNIFSFMKETYKNFFTLTKIKEILSRTHDAFLPFVVNTIELASTDTAITVVKYLSEIFQHEKLKLREILSHRNYFGQTIFSWFKDNQEYEVKLKVFVELLRGTFNEDENFDPFLNSLQIPSKLAFFVSIQEKYRNSSYFLNDTRSFVWAVSDYHYLIFDWDKIQLDLGARIFPSLLMSKNFTNHSLLFNLIQFEGNEDNVEPFFNKLKLNLNKSDISTLLFVQESINHETVLMFAARYCNEKVLKLLWDFIKEILSEIELEKILKVENKASMTSLQYATWNIDPNSFLFMKQIYELNIPNEIEGILSKTHDNYLSFTTGSILEASLETVREVVKFLAEIFKDKIIKLRDIIVHENQSNDTNPFMWYNNEEYDIEEKAELFKIFDIETSNDYNDDYLDV